MAVPLFSAIYKTGRIMGYPGTMCEIVTALLDAKADPNFRFLKSKELDEELDTTQYLMGFTVLQAAVAHNQLEIVRNLIQAGADVNATAHYLRGRTALQMASTIGSMDMFRVLRTYNADVNDPAARRRGATALQAAATKGHFEMVRILSQDGAKIYTPALEKGRHALEGAAEYGRLDIVVLLLDNDDEPSTFRKRCMEAAKRAASEKHSVIAKILTERAAAHVWPDDDS